MTALSPKVSLFPTAGLWYNTDIMETEMNGKGWKQEMSYQINLGEWNSVFAVPSSLVDQHMKLAGAVQLKVLLWVLRHSGEEISDETLAAAVGASPADTRDAMQYWVETGLLTQDGSRLSPCGAREPEPPTHRQKHPLQRNRKAPGWFPFFPRLLPPQRKTGRKPLCL